MTLVFLVEWASVSVLQFRFHCCVVLELLLQFLIIPNISTVFVIPHAAYFDIIQTMKTVRFIEEFYYLDHLTIHVHKLPTTRPFTALQVSNVKRPMFDYPAIVTSCWGLILPFIFRVSPLFLLIEPRLWQHQILTTRHMVLLPISSFKICLRFCGNWRL